MTERDGIAGEDFARIPADAELADYLRTEIVERYPAFAHGGIGRIGLSLASAEWRQIIGALEQLRGQTEVSSEAAPDQSVGVHPAGTETTTSEAVAAGTPPEVLRLRETMERLIGFSGHRGPHGGASCRAIVHERNDKPIAHTCGDDPEGCDCSERDEYWSPIGPCDCGYDALLTELREQLRGATATRQELPFTDGVDAPGLRRESGVPTPAPTGDIDAIMVKVRRYRNVEVPEDAACLHDELAADIEELLIECMERRGGSPTPAHREGQS